MHDNMRFPVGKKRSTTLLVASAGCAITVLDTNVVGIVLPSIARDLDASFSQVQWFISAYVLLFAALLLPAGSIADRHGRKPVLLIGITWFLIASVACGLASTASALYLARAAQGAGAAFLLAPALAIIGHAFHDEPARTRAWATWGGIMGLTMVASPLLGGVIGEQLGWRWAFLINIPICVVLAAAVLIVVDDSRDPAREAIDAPGILLFTSAMFGVTWALITGPIHGWGSTPVLMAATAGVLLFAMFVLVEWRSRQPMLDLSLFSAWPFLGAVLAMFAYAASAQVMAALLPLYLQNGRGHDALAAGIGMLPFALAMLVFPRLGRRLAAGFGSARTLAFGLAVVALGNLVSAFAVRASGDLPLMLGMAVVGAGGGLLNGETQKAILSNVARNHMGMASGISTTSRFSGILLGFAGLGAVLASGTRSALERATSIAGLQMDADLAARIAAGNLSFEAWEHSRCVATELTAVARESYRSGFSDVNLAAATIAFAAAISVLVMMRHLPRHDVHSYPR